MIADFELNHPVSKKFNGLLAFIRAEPIWNWDSNKVAGLSGFDFRLYGGLRIALNKPSYYSSVENLRKQALESAGLSPDQTINQSTNNMPISTSDSSADTDQNSNSTFASPATPNLVSPLEPLPLRSSSP